MKTYCAKQVSLITFRVIIQQRTSADLPLVLDSINKRRRYSKGQLALQENHHLRKTPIFFQNRRKASLEVTMT